MAPAVLAGALAGRRIVAAVPQRAFEALVVLLTAASTVLMFL
jgi:uncharacterized membrane protein YfcA